MTSKVYMNLFQAIEKLGVTQEFFIATKDKSQNVKNIVPNLKQHYTFAHCLRNWMKISFILKLFSMWIALRKTPLYSKLPSTDFVHCHTLFSDGGLGYLLKRLFKLKYIITIRHTDVNFYLKYFPHLRLFAALILKSSESVVFISDSYQKKFAQLHPYLFDKIKHKSVVRPNAIDDFWHKNNSQTCKELFLKKRKKLKIKPISLIYVGACDRNKNLATLCKITSVMNTQGFEAHLNIIGCDKEDFIHTYGKHHELKQVTFLGKIYDKNKLLTFYRTADIFLMLSHHETFGLVYLEALTQGTPVICSQGQGICGMFSNDFVRSVPSTNVNSAIKLIVELSNSSLEEKSIITALSNYTWEAVALEYKEMYRNY